MWFLKLGFLDGWQGWIFTKLHLCYELMIDMNVKELLRRRGDAGYLGYVGRRLPGAREIVESLGAYWKP